MVVFRHRDIPSNMKEVVEVLRPQAALTVENQWESASHLYILLCSAMTSSVVPSHAIKEWAKNAYDGDMVVHEGCHQV